MKSFEHIIRGKNTFDTFCSDFFSFSACIDRFSDNFRLDWGELIRINVAHDYKLQILDTHLFDYFAEVIISICCF